MNTSASRILSKNPSQGKKFGWVHGDADPAQIRTRTASKASA